MGAHETREWSIQAQAALNLVTGTIGLIQNEAVIDDISLLGQMGNHVIDVVDFVRSSTDAPTDKELEIHWNQFLALTRAAGLEVTHAATLTFDLTPFGALARQISGEINVITDLIHAANIELDGERR
jgi:hypothetical protein